MKLKKTIGVLILVWLIITMSGGLALRNNLTGRSEQKTPAKGENTSRVAFFSDIHIQNSKGEVQTDIGAPSAEIPKNTKIALKTLNPDYIFNTGDSTTHAEINEWSGYDHWIEDFEAPVFEVFGNHDREHHPGDNYGIGYFTEMERISGTKVLKLGNNVFILVSEEHNPEFDHNNLASTVPQKRFEFVENQIKEYSGSNNIFIMSKNVIDGLSAISTISHYNYMIF